MFRAQAEEIILFTTLQINAKTICENCKKKEILDRWNVFLACLYQSGDKAQLTCYLCVDCYDTPTKWLWQKTIVERRLRDQGLSEVELRIEYIRAGQCPVCEIRRVRSDVCKKALKNDDGTPFHVTFDELLEIKARKIVYELEYKRKHRAERERERQYVLKMSSVIDEMVVKAEVKQLKSNEKDRKVKAIL